MRVDSKVGLQLDYALSERWHFTTQAVSKQRESGNWSPELEWAFAKYNLLPTLAIRSGRMRLPVYMMSDTLDVNYANPWIRPPVEVYGSNPLSGMNLDGVDLLWRPTTGPVSWLIQPFYGMTRFNVRGGPSFDSNDMYGSQVSASWGDFTLRGAAMHLDGVLHYPKINTEVIPALQALCGYTRDLAACQQAAGLKANGHPMVIGTLGLAWDNGDYFVNSEYAMRDSQYLSPSDNSSWYLTLGTRLNKWTPYVSYARLTNNGPSKFTAGKGALPGFSTNSVVTEVMTVNPMDQATITLGMRYDLMSNLAVKFQWDHIDTFTKDGQDRTGRGVFVTWPSAFENRNNTVDLFSLSMDFAF